MRAAGRPHNPDWEDHDQDIDDIACKLPHDIVDEEDQDFDDIVVEVTGRSLGGSL